MPVSRSRSGSNKLLRENLRLRGDLISVATRVSHDLQTPLSGINIECERLKRALADSGLFEPICAATQEISRLLARINFMLKASAKPERKKTVRMEEVVAGVLERLESQILSRNASIIQPPQWPQVRGVGRWLEAIWWNLIANALQHGRPAPQIQLGWRKSARGFRFWVKDDGEGILPEDRKQLFQKFHTLHKLNSKHGLGLSIVQRLVELQGGTSGYSRNAGGTCFYFTIPRR